MQSFNANANLLYAGLNVTQWDIGYAKTWEDATLFLDNLYSERPPIEDFLAWRDLRVWDEIHWYGWFIDYYMEGGLMRDIFTHKITTPQHWNMLMMPTIYTRAELDYDLVVGANTVVSPSYDPHCLNDITEGCQPVAVISAENLRDYSKGPSETALIANVLLRDPRMGNYVIDQSTWNCSKFSSFSESRIFYPVLLFLLLVVSFRPHSLDRTHPKW
jgi:hypothetical protein